jgi:RNA polymerase sigma-70 factor (ECF subfamily)
VSRGFRAAEEPSAGKPRFFDHPSTRGDPLGTARETTVQATDPRADAELLVRLRAGDGCAYEEVLRLHGSWMLGLARRLLGDEEAEDAVQDACLSAFRSIGSFEGKARVSTWLHRIVVNAALMRLRTRKRRLESTVDALLPTFRADRTYSAPPATWRDQPHALMEDEETAGAVRRAVGRVPAPYRTVLVLRDVEGLEIGEIARLLGLTLSGAKSRLHRARQALRTLLEPVLAERQEPARVG